MLERDLVELHTFTKMEKHFDTEWNVLNEKFAAATAQIEELQAERQSALQRWVEVRKNLHTFSHSYHYNILYIHTYIYVNKYW